VYGLQGRDADALDAAERALRLFEAAGDRVGQAIALTDVGWYHGRLGHHQQALAFCTSALRLHQELDNRPYQAHTWSCLGETHQHLGDQPQAIACYQRALDLFREFGDRYGEASTSPSSARFITAPATPTRPAMPGRRPGPSLASSTRPPPTRFARASAASTSRRRSLLGAAGCARCRPVYAGMGGRTSPPITCAVVCTVTRPPVTSVCTKSRNAVNLAGLIA
jgi:tetratricopeptide (TPR) repeat protein